MKLRISQVVLKRGLDLLGLQVLFGPGQGLFRRHGGDFFAPTYPALDRPSETGHRSALAGEEKLSGLFGAIQPRLPGGEVPRIVGRFVASNQDCLAAVIPPAVAPGGAPRFPQLVRVDGGSWTSGSGWGGSKSTSMFLRLRPCSVQKTSMFFSQDRPVITRGCVFTSATSMFFRPYYIQYLLFSSLLSLHTKAFSFFLRALYVKKDGRSGRNYLSVRNCYILSKNKHGRFLDVVHKNMDVRPLLACLGAIAGPYIRPARAMEPA